MNVVELLDVCKTNFIILNNKINLKFGIFNSQFIYYT